MIRKPASILFVCTGNVFRSMSAEFAVRRACAGLPYHIQSAGTHSRPDITAWPHVGDYLRHVGLDVSGHIPRRLDRAILDSADIVVAMGADHRDFIRETFGYRSRLYLDIATGQDLPLPDVCDVIEDHENNIERGNAHIAQTIDMIMRHAAAFAERMPRYLK